MSDQRIKMTGAHVADGKMRKDGEELTVSSGEARQLRGVGHAEFSDGPAAKKAAQKP